MDITEKVLLDYKDKIKKELSVTTKNYNEVMGHDFEVVNCFCMLKFVPRIIKMEINKDKTLMQFLFDKNLENAQEYLDKNINENNYKKHRFRIVVDDNHLDKKLKEYKIKD